MGNTISLLWPGIANNESQQKAKAAGATACTPMPGDTNNITLHGGTVNAVGGNMNTFITHNYGIASDSQSPAIARVRKSLSTASFPTIQRDTYEKRIAGTGFWLLELDEFKEWLNTRGKIFWATGMPGAGKTHLAACVINYLQDLAKKNHKILVAFAYFRYSDPMAVLKVLESLVRQLAESSPTAAETVATRLAGIEAESGSPSQADYIDLLKATSNESNATFFILDALDESPPDAQFDLLQVFSSIDANICIFSRPLKGMQSVVQASLRDVVFIEVAAQDQDIELMIAERLERSPDFRELLQDDTVKQEVIDKVKKKARGMFLHAALQIEALRHCINLADVRRTLEHFPADIAKMYLATVERIECQHGQRPDLAKRILIWLLYLKWSIPIKDLQHALAISPDDETFDRHNIASESLIISVCCGLVTMDSESGSVRLIHETAKDVLQNALRTFCGQPHTLIAKSCLSYLVSCGIADWRKEHNPSRNLLFNTLVATPFLSYSYHQLKFHFQSGMSERTSDLSKYAEKVIPQFLSFPVGASYGELSWKSSPLHIAAWLGVPAMVRKMTTQATFNVNGGDENRPPLTPLMLASRGGCDEVVELLLETPGLLIEARDARGRTALSHAVESHTGNVQTIRRLLSFPGIEVNTKEYTLRRTPLMLALEGCEGAVAALLEAHGIEVNAVDDVKLTALMRAAAGDNKGAIEALLAFPGIDLDAQEESGLTAFMLSCQARGLRRGLSAFLALEDIDVNAVDRQGRTGLMHACSFYSQASALTLLNFSKTNPKLADHKGNTALIIATQEGAQSTVQRLLEFDIDVNAKNDKGRTALYYAWLFGHPAIGKILLSHPGIVITPADAFLQALVQKNTPVTIITTLLADPEILADKDHLGNSLLVASRCNLEEVVLSLTRIPGIQLDASTDGSGSQPLIYAATHGQKRIVEILLGVPGIQPNAFDDGGKNALIHSAAGGYEEVVKALLDFPGIEVNLEEGIVNGDRKTALIQAAKRGHEGVVRLLLGYPGIDVNAVDYIKRTATSRASEYGHHNIVELIAQHPQYKPVPSKDTL